MYNNLSNLIAYSNFTKLVGLIENNTYLSINVVHGFKIQLINVRNCAE